MEFVSYCGYILSQLFYFCLQFALFPVTTFTFFWPVLISFFRFYSSCISNVAFPIAYTMLVIYGMVSALGNYRRRILFSLSWISLDNFTFGSFSLGSIWSKVNGSGFPVLIKNIVQVLYPFLQVPHLYSLERSQLLQHPQPLALLIIIHNWLSNIAFFLRVVTSATWTSSLRRKRILWVLYFRVLETSGVFS